jgi:hypothetical protein
MSNLCRRSAAHSSALSGPVSEARVSGGLAATRLQQAAEVSSPCHPERKRCRFCATRAKDPIPPTRSGPHRGPSTRGKSGRLLRVTRLGNFFSSLFKPRPCTKRLLDRLWRSLSYPCLLSGYVNFASCQVTESRVSILLQCRRLGADCNLRQTPSTDSVSVELLAHDPV